MAKYKVLKKFRDTHTKEVYAENAEVEFTEERAAEVGENLKGFIEIVEEEEEEKEVEFDREATKERLTELGVDFKGNASNDTLKQLLEENEEGGE